MKNFVVNTLAIIGACTVIHYIAKEEKWQKPKLPEFRIRVIFGEKKS